MRIKYVLGTGCLLAAMTAWPALAISPTSQSCTPGEPTPESYTWNFHQEASNLLNGIQADAVRVENHAARLQAEATNTDLDWHADVAQLDPIKAQVNDMGRKLCRLEVIRRVVAPWQQQAIDHAARQVTLMADNTQDAIQFLDTHRTTLWMPTYQLYGSNLYNESRQLSRSLTGFTEYANDRTEVQHLKNELGIKARS